MNRLFKTTLGSFIVATVVLHQVSAAGLFGRPSSVLSRWGGERRSAFVQQETAVSSPRQSLHDIRGGSTAMENEEVTVDAEQLYLPGLLDASVVRSNSVRHPSFLSGSTFTMETHLVYTC